MDIDERIFLADRGRGRDLGGNPAFTGAKPRTRQESRMPAGLEVGGYGHATETVRSFAANSIPFTIDSSVATPITQQLASGAGTVMGINFTIFTTGNAALYLQLLAGNTPVWSHVALTANVGSVTATFGDFGLNYNGLSLKSWFTNHAALTATFINQGCVYIGTVE